MQQKQTFHGKLTSVKLIEGSCYGALFQGVMDDIDDDDHFDDDDGEDWQVIHNAIFGVQLLFA